jgi:hypothetical protein
LKPEEVVMVANADGQCRIIMRDGVPLPGMTLPALGPPRPDPHPNPIVQAMRDAWNMKIIAWDAVWDQRPRWLLRREAGHWRDLNVTRRAPALKVLGDADVEAEDN